VAIVADPDADLEGSLAEWRRYRRRRQLVDVHWVDALYRVYLTALFASVAFLLASNAVGDDPLGPSGVADVREYGAAVVGLAVAAVLAVGLRSGSRGGPLALERADVHHVLLAPVDRRAALWGPAVRQVRFAVFAGAAVGAAAGHLAAQRLPHSDLAWATCGAAVAAGAVAAGYGIAMLTAGLRVRSWLASLVALVLVAWSVGDVSGSLPAAPTSFLGRLALWPLDVDWWALAGVVGAVALLIGGFGRLWGISLEAAVRRSVLVGQMRFAATLQDVRTVIVLRRQLALEIPRVRPWVRLRPRVAERTPVWLRDSRSLLRWPLPRIGRTVLLAGAAGLALRGVWDGTTPLLVVAGVAVYVVALDIVEPLAQEVDHPSRRDSLPILAGELNLRHLPGVVAGAVLVAVVGAAIAIAVAPSVTALEVGAAAVLPAALGLASSGVVSVLMGAPAYSGANVVVPPEAAGMKVIVRAVWPPLLAIAGLVPVLAARAADDAGEDPVAAAAGVAVLPVLVFALVCAWVRFRDPALAWYRAQVEQAFSTDKTAEAGRG
jgi:hypothetical protein